MVSRSLSGSTPHGGVATDADASPPTGNVRKIPMKFCVMIPSFLRCVQPCARMKSSKNVSVGEYFFHPPSSKLV